MPRLFEEHRAHWLLRLLGNVAVFAVFGSALWLLWYVFREGARAGGLL